MHLPRQNSFIGRSVTGGVAPPGAGVTAATFSPFDIAALVAAAPGGAAAAIQANAAAYNTALGRNDLATALNAITNIGMAGVPAGNPVYARETGTFRTALAARGPLAGAGLGRGIGGIINGYL
jgi:hypothetical protein